MLWIARERRKNHLQSIRETGAPNELLYQSPFDKRLDLGPLIEELERNSKKRRRFFPPKTPTRAIPMRRLSNIRRLHRRSKISPSSSKSWRSSRRNLTPALSKIRKKNKTLRPKSEPVSSVRYSIAIPKRKRLRRPAEKPRKRIRKPPVPSRKRLRGAYDPTPGFCDAPTLEDLEECQV